MYGRVMVPSGHVAAPPTFIRLAAHPLRWQLLTALAESDYRVRDLVSRVGQPQNLLSYHLRQLRDGGLVRATRSTFDGRDSYYHLDLDRCAAALVAGGAALHPALRRDPAAPAFPVDQRRSPPVAVLRCTRCCAWTRHHPSPRADSGRDVSPCCSCAPATAPAHRSPKHCCATARPAA